MNYSNFQLRILVGDKPINEYNHQGNVFVEGRKGSEFVLEFTNRTNSRVLVVPSVDGLSTLDGKEATPESKGYIVPAWGVLKIPGWTIDGQSVAKFLFQDKERSYVYQSGQGNVANAGVVGVLIYGEKKEEYSLSADVFRGITTKRSDESEPWKVNNQTSATLSSNEISESTSDEPFSIGTGWGGKADFKVNQVVFNRGGLETQMLIYYDSRRNLEKRGIQVVKKERSYLNTLPQAFSGIGCTPPPGWKG